LGRGASDGADSYDPGNADGEADHERFGGGGDDGVGVEVVSPLFEEGEWEGVVIGIRREAAECGVDLSAIGWCWDPLSEERVGGVGVDVVGGGFELVRKHSMESVLSESEAVGEG